MLSVIFNRYFVKQILREIYSMRVTSLITIKVYVL